MEYQAGGEFMADRIITELIVQGAQQFVNDFSKAGQAVSGLAVVTETTGVRQRAAYDAIGAAAEQAAKRVEVAAKRQEEALKNIEPNIISRGVTPRLQRFQQAAAPPPQVIQPIPSNAVAGAQQLAGTLGQITAAANEVAVAETRKTKAIHDESAAHSKAGSTGITYLSTLSAIHAASFLLSNRTFTLIGSLFTLGAAFSKLGVGASLIGATFGGVLLFLNGLFDGIQRLQQIFISAAVGLAGFAAAATAAIGAGATAGIKLAADVETQLGLVKAITGATTEELGQLDATITNIALRFGVASVEVAKAASLFTRAGGGIKEAINGATEAVIQLQVASAGELKAADAARAIATGLKAFTDEGVTAIDVANALTATAQRTALSFTEVSQAFQQAVPGSVTLGIKLRDLSTIIAVLGETLRGTVAGTSFKQFLLDLVNPSKQAQEALNELGVSIVNAADPSKVRPIFDIINDLTKALDGLGQPQRAQVIAQIFESRAGLAGALLSRQTVDKLQAVRAELDKITAVRVANINLLPLNKQVEVLLVTIQEVGRAFGGPFLQPLREATVAAINLFRSMIEPAKLLGQTIAVVVTDQGFGQLRQRIVEISGGNIKLSVFLQELVNSFRNVADVVRRQILPALGDFAAIISGSFQLGDVVDISRTFTQINRTIQQVGASTAVLIRHLGLLISEFIQGTGTGGRLREELQSIATAILTRVAVSLTTMAVFTAIAAKALIALGDTAAAIAKSIGGVFEKLAEINNGIANSFIDLGLNARKAAAGVRAGTSLAAGDIEGFQEARKEIEALDTLLNAPRIVRNPVTQTLRELAAVTATAQAAAKGLVDAFDPETLSANANEIVERFNKLAGEIPNALSNLRAEAEEEARVLREVLEGTTGAPTAPASNPEVKRAQDRLIEAARDFNRRLQALNEETATRAQEIGDRATERIGDIFQKASQQLDRLARDTAERIQDLNDAFTQRRTERDFLETFQKSIDARLRAFQKNVDREELIESRALDRIRTARQRANEDTARGFDLVEQSAERAFGRAQQDAERAFGAVQRASDKAFEAQQSAQEKALSAQLDAQAQLRSNARELAEAKPADRAQVLQRQQLAAQDRQFQQGQAAQLDALRARQQASQAARQQQQEQAQVGFRRQQEEAQLQFRLAAERRALAFRRSAEDAERIVREQEEDQSLVRRLDREERLRVFREANEVAVARVRDKFEEQALQRSIQNARDDETRRRADIETERDRQVNEVVDTANIQLTERANQLIKSLNDIDRALDDVLENIAPDIRGQVGTEIARLQAIVAQGRATALTEFETAREKALALIETARILGESKLGGALGATQLGATQLTPQNIQQPMTNAFVQGLRIARDQGLVLGQQITVNVQSTQEAENFIEGIR